MSETAPASVAAGALDAADEPTPAPLLDRSGPLLAVVLLVGLIVFAAALLTGHTRPEVQRNSGAARTYVVLSHWLNEG